MTAAAQTIAMSTANRALPISTSVRLRKIMARMSVPPVDAPMSKTRALPSAGRSTAKQTSKVRSPVMDCVTGKIHSKSETYAESAMEANELQIMALRSRNTKPRMTSATLSTHINDETGSCGKSAPRTMATPWCRQRPGGWAS